jgi:hypothetical protein
MTLEVTRATDLHPVLISLGLDVSDFGPDVGGQQAGTSVSAGRFFDTALRGIDIGAAQWSDHVWFFKGGSYTSLVSGATDFEPWRPMRDWPGWPMKFAAVFDAAVQGTGRYFVWYYFFAGDTWIGYNQSIQRVVGEPRPIAPEWGGVQEPFSAGIDAAIHGVTEEYDGKAYLFKGSQYLRYDMNVSAVDVPPASIAERWGQGSWPASFDRIDYCFYGEPPNESTTIFFFRGEEYLAYDLKSDRVVTQPRPAVDRWPMFGRFAGKPQLFLEEHYTLHRFLGQTGRGEILDTIGLAGGAKQESKIVTKINERRKETSVRNILESTSTAAVDDTADATNAQSSSSFDQEDYGYEGKMSARGEASWGPTSGEANIDVAFQGSSQNVREGFASSVGKELSRRSTDTMETNREETSIQSADFEINKTTETELKYTFDNSQSADSVNFAIVQLTQEFIVLLSLSAVKVCFYNGDAAQAQSVPLSGLTALLSAVVPDPVTRERVRLNVVQSLQSIVDINGETRTFATAEGDAVSVPHDLATTFTPQDNPGQPVRTFTVPGVAISVERPVILTTNTIVVPLV